MLETSHKFKPDLSNEVICDACGQHITHQLHEVETVCSRPARKEKSLIAEYYEMKSKFENALK